MCHPCDACILFLIPQTSLNLKIPDRVLRPLSCPHHSCGAVVSGSPIKTDPPEETLQDSCVGCCQLFLPFYVKASLFWFSSLLSRDGGWKSPLKAEDHSWKHKKSSECPLLCQAHVICSEECEHRLWVEMGGQKTNRQTQKALHIQKRVREWEQ